MRISRDGRRFWAACARTQTVLEVDTESGAVLKRLPTSRDGAWFVEVNRDETKLYTPNLEGKSVSVITRASGEVKVLPLEDPGYGIDITPDGKHVLVTGRGVTVIDTSSDTISRTIATTPPRHRPHSDHTRWPARGCGDGEIGRSLRARHRAFSAGDDHCRQARR